MARKNHPGKRPSGTTSSKWLRTTAGGGRDISRILDPAPTVESDRYGDWFVQYIPAVNARKTYTCPECYRPIPPGTAHLVVWQEATCWAENVPLMNAATGTGTVGAAAENNSRILCASPPFLGLRYTYPD